MTHFGLGVTLYRLCDFVAVNIWIGWTYRGRYTYISLSAGKCWNTVSLIKDISLLLKSLKIDKTENTL